MQSVQGGLFPYTVSHGSPYTVCHGLPYTVSPGHHGQKHFIGTKTAIAKNLQLALVAGVMANGPSEPPRAKHWPADTAEQTMEYWLATGTKHNANHRPLARAWEL
jgi:hypothetical protein